MFTCTSDYEKAMVKALKCIQTGDLKFKKLYEEYDNIEAGDVIKRCIDLKYIEDISYAQTSSKLVTFDKDNTRLSYDGLKFLEENDFTDISHFPLIIDDLKI